MQVFAEDGHRAASNPAPTGETTALVLGGNCDHAVLLSTATDAPAQDSDPSASVHSVPGTDSHGEPRAAAAANNNSPEFPFESDDEHNTDDLGPNQDELTAALCNHPSLVDIAIGYIGSWFDLE